jgi:hypothetical protein
MNDISEFVVEDSTGPLEKGSLVILAEPLVGPAPPPPPAAAEALGSLGKEKEEEIELVEFNATHLPDGFVDVPLEPLGQPAYMEDKEEEERLYLRPAARKAYHVTRVETLREFKRVTGKDYESQWKCINSPSSPFVLLVADVGALYMLKAQLPAHMTAERVIRMCIDFDNSTRLRWDHDLTYVRVLEEFPEDSIRVVQWKARKSPAALFRSPPGGVSVLSWDYERRYVVATHIAAHRAVTARDYNAVEGWSAVYIKPEEGTVIAVFSLQCRDMPGYAAYYAAMLEERVTLMEGICSKWNYYYT